MTKRATSLPSEVPIEVRYSAGQALVFAEAGVRAAPDKVAAAKDSEVEIVAYSGGKMDFGYFAMYVDLAGMEKAADGVIPILRQHDGGKIAGQSKSIEASPERGLVVKADLYDQAGEKGTEHGREVAMLAAKGFRWQSSIGFRCDSGKYQYLDDEDQKASVNGIEVAGPAIIARRSSLKEASLVPLGADANTSMATITASATIARPPSKKETTKMAAATKAELLAAFPDPEDKEFVLDQRDAEATLEQAQIAHGKILGERLKQAKADLAAAKAAPAPAPAKAPALSPRRPVEVGAAAPQRNLSAAAQFNEMLAAKKATGLSDTAARREIAKDYPDVQAAYVAEASGGAQYAAINTQRPWGQPIAS